MFSRCSRDKIVSERVIAREPTRPGDVVERKKILF